jgi:hypothetical protein
VQTKHSQVRQGRGWAVCSWLDRRGEGGEEESRSEGGEEAHEVTVSTLENSALSPLGDQGLWSPRSSGHISSVTATRLDTL